jgi:hypothetical protein
VNRGRYPEIEAFLGGHNFDRVCDMQGIKHRLIKPYHPLRRLLPAVLAESGSVASPSGSPEPDSAADG